jgi:hypothetical protein
MRDTWRETKSFQGGPGSGGRPAIIWFLSKCLSVGVRELEGGFSKIEMHISCKTGQITETGQTKLDSLYFDRHHTHTGSRKYVIL